MRACVFCTWFIVALVFDHVKCSFLRILGHLPVLAKDSVACLGVLPSEMKGQDSNFELPGDTPVTYAEQLAIWMTGEDMLPITCEGLQKFVVSLSGKFGLYHNLVTPLAELVDEVIPELFKTDRDFFETKFVPLLGILDNSSSVTNAPLKVFSLLALGNMRLKHGECSQYRAFYERMEGADKRIEYDNMVKKIILPTQFGGAEGKRNRCVASFCTAAYLISMLRISSPEKDHEELKSSLDKTVRSLSESDENLCSIAIDEFYLNLFDALLRPEIAESIARVKVSLEYLRGTLPSYESF